MYTKEQYNCFGIPRLVLSVPNILVTVIEANTDTDTVTNRAIEN